MNVSEADLHAYTDLQLTPERHAAVAAYLAQNPAQAERVRRWQQDSEALRQHLQPVLDQPVPARLRLRGATSTIAANASRWRQAAAVASVALLAGGAGWTLRGQLGSVDAPVQATHSPETLTGFAQRAAVAHAVYTPERRRPVEVAADQEQQLVTWLSRRLGSPVKAPALAPLGYQLVGGRLLPGETAPVAQFMYQDSAGERLTLYLTREVPVQPGQPDTAFHVGQSGSTQVFYWVDQGFGYALSGSLARPELLRVSQEVYRQLAPGQKVIGPVQGPAPNEPAIIK